MREVVTTPHKTQKDFMKTGHPPRSPTLRALPNPTLSPRVVEYHQPDNTRLVILCGVFQIMKLNEKVRENEKGFA